MDEKCAQREQQNASERDIESTDIKADILSAYQAHHTNAAHILVQEFQHTEVSTELSCQCTEENLQGKYCFIAFLVQIVQFTCW